MLTVTVWGRVGDTPAPEAPAATICCWNHATHASGWLVVSVHVADIALDGATTSSEPDRGVSSTGSSASTPTDCAAPERPTSVMAAVVLPGAPSSVRLGRATTNALSLC